MIMLSMFKSQALNHTLNPMQTHLLKHTQKRLGLRTQTCTDLCPKFSLDDPMDALFSEKLIVNYKNICIMPE